MSVVFDTTVRISLIVFMALGVTVALTRRSAALRHWVLTIGIACGAATPVLQLVLPSWYVGPAAFSSAVPVQSQTSDVAMTVVVQNAPAPEGQTAHEAVSVNADGSVSRMPMALLSMWLAGALMSLSMLVVGLSRLSRIASAARPVKAGPLLAIARDIQEAMGVRRPVTLLQSSDPTLLITWGAARPTVILPDDASKWPEDRARVVLRHEFAHIARGDWLTQMLAETLRAVYWFNPLLWIACRRLRDEGERACDDAVLNAGVEPTNYASHLLQLAQNATRPAARRALAMARSSSLEGRVSAMLNAHMSRHPLRAATRIATLVAFAAVTVPVAIAQNRFWSFSGTVVDQTNHFVPDTTLVLTNGSTHAKYQVRADRTGHFEFPGLPSGDYRLAVQQVGFKTFTDTVAVAGKDVTRTIQLQIGSVHESITVTDGPKEPVQSDSEQQAALERARQRAQDIRQRASETCGSAATADQVGGRILAPVKVTDVRPEYPEALKAGGIGGVVTLDALIGTDGTVRDVRAVSSSHPELEHAAADAVRRWEFSTTYLNCTPIDVPMRVTINFVAR